MTELRDPMLPPKTKTHAMTGFVFCVIIAALSIVYFQDHRLQTALPLIFVAVVALAARCWGRTGAIAGLVSAASMFAYFLYEPFGSLTVASPAARANIRWMLLFGSVAACLLRRSEELDTDQEVYGQLAGAFLPASSEVLHLTK
jgi:K+-sensing histidine kinase KdpD